MFDACVEIGPGILGKTKRRGSDASSQDRRGRNDLGSTAQRLDSDTAGIEEKQSKKRGDEDKLPESKTTTTSS